MLNLRLCIQSRNTRRIRFAQQQLVRVEKKEKKLPAGLQNQLAIFNWWSFPNAVPKMFCSWQLIPLFTFTLTFLLFFSITIYAKIRCCCFYYERYDGFNLLLSPPISTWTHQIYPLGCNVIVNSISFHSRLNIWI